MRRLAAPLALAALLGTVIVTSRQADGVSAAPSPRARAVTAATSRATTVGQRGEVVTFLGGSTRRPLTPPDDEVPENIARQFVDEFGAAFGVEEPEEDLVENRTSEGAGGTVAIRYQQTFEGVPVIGGELAVQVGADGRVLSATGEASSDLAVDTATTVSAEQAAATAVAVTERKDDLAAELLHVELIERWIYDPELLGVDDDVLGPRVVWRVEVRTEMGDIDRLVLVDATSGAVALTFSQRHAIESVSVCDKANVPGNTLGCASPVVSPLVANAMGGQIAMAFNLTSATYQFYKSHFGRDSVDNLGHELRSTVRFCPSTGCPYRNAFWNGIQMVYGDGYAAADDVVAHELTHGVTEHESDLFYFAESGAINESLSDVFGELFDLGNTISGADPPAHRWLMGEQLPFGPIRSMAHPPQFGDPDRMTSPLFHGSPTDDHGVHINSGVNNKAAFLMTDGGAFNDRVITPLGATKTLQIYYEAQTTLLGPGSDYLDLSKILPQACINLSAVGVTTAADCAEVQQIVLATEMDLRPTTPGADRTAPICDSGSVNATLFTDDMENPASGKWTFGSTPGTGPKWEYYTGSSQSGTRSLRGPDAATPSDTWARTTAPVAITSSQTYLRFDHAFGFEYDDSPFTYYDGGVVEYSINGGAQWADAGILAGTVNGYVGTLEMGGSNPLQGRPAYVATSPGYQESRITLSSLVGSNVLFRFRIGTDLFASGDGWFLDDVSIYSCAEASGPPTTTASGTTLPLPSFVASGPARVFDTRGGESPSALRAVVKSQVSGEQVLEVKVTDLPGIVPATGVGSVALNVAVTRSTAAGFVSVFPCGPRPFVANVNHSAGEIVSNGVIAPVSPSGTVCFYSLVPADLVVDINGWFPAGGGLSAAGPTRVFDTRPGQSPGAARSVAKSQVGGATVLEVQMSDIAGVVPAAGVAAVSLNVAVTGSVAPGFVTAFPCGARPLVASLNHAAAETVSNSVIAPLSSTGTVCFFSLAPVDLIVDLNGWFATGPGVTPVGPARVFDTRGDSPNALRSVEVGTFGGPSVLEVKVTDLPGLVPATGVSAVSLNVAVTGSNQPGFVSAYPCGPRPLAASVNHAAQETVSNGVIAPVSATGTVCFFSFAPAHLIVDVNGWFGQP